MLTAFVNAFRTPDLRRKLLFVLFIIFVFRLGSQIPAPGVHVSNVQHCLGDEANNTGIYNLINLFSGGALLQLTVFALGIMPYITASIILQLLVVVIPRLEALKKEGQAGQAKITQYTRYLTVALAVLQSTGVVAIAREPGRLIQGCNRDLVPNQSLLVIISMVITMTAGTTVIMWLGELITDRGIGNGMSLLIFTSIVSGFPAQLSSIQQTKSIGVLVLVIVIGVFIMAGIVFVGVASVVETQLKNRRKLAEINAGPARHEVLARLEAIEQRLERIERALTEVPG